MMQSAKPISVIVQRSTEFNEAKTLEFAKKLGHNGGRIELIVVGDRGAEAVLCSDGSNGNRVRYFPTLSKAVGQAYYDTIAILQGQPVTDSRRISELADRLTENTFICDYQQSKSPAGYKGLLFLTHRLLNRVLLKSEACQFDHAVLVFQRSRFAIETITEAVKPTEVNPRPVAALNQLISGLKMAGKSNVLTVSDGFVAKSASHTTVNSKAILSATGEIVKGWWNSVMFPKKWSPSTRPTTPSKKALRILGWAALCLIAALMLNQNLRFALFEPDEARNAQLSLNMMDSGNWMALELKNDHYWDKPPLVAWMTAVSFKIFGVSENAARFPGVVVSFLTVILTCAIGQRLVGFRAAWVAAFLVLLSLGVPFSGRYLTMDSTLTMLATVTFLSVYRGSFGRRFRQAWWVLAGICVGLGLITKGPVIVVLCGVPAVVFSWLSGRRMFTSAKQALYFAAPMLLIGSPWFVATAVGTPEFLTHFFWQHHVVRFTDGISHQQPFWFYLPVILVLMFPASQLFLPLVKFMSTRKPSVRALRTDAHGYLFLSAMWVLVFFTCSQAKLPTYILPAVPMLCLLMASVIDINVFAKLDPRTENAEHDFAAVCEVNYIEDFYRRLPKWFALNMAAWVVVLSGAILWLLPQYQASVAVMVVSLLGLIVMSIVASNKRSHPYAAWMSVGVLALFVSVMIVNQIIPAIANTRSVQRAVTELKSTNGRADSPVVYYARDSFATSMTLGDADVVYFSKEETAAAATFLRSHPWAIVVTATEYLEELGKSIRPQVALAKQSGMRHVYLASPVANALSLTSSNHSPASTSSKPTERIARGVDNSKK